MEKPDPKKKVTGYKIKRTPGKVVQQGKPAQLHHDFERGTSKSTYTPTKVETGHPAYGKPGGGTDKEMNSLISEAQRKRQDVTPHSSKGLSYKAGTTTTVKTPEKFNTSIKVTPKIQKVNVSKEPMAVKAKSGSGSTGGLKPMSVTLGGSDKKGNPANKTGLGTPKRVKIRSVKSFPKY